MLAVVPPPVTVRVPAKVNLYLSVGAPRGDGYHELSTVFHSMSLADEVTVSAADEPGIDVTGEGAGTVPTDGANLAWRAACALADYAGKDRGVPRIRIGLHKSIPVAGGLAGGSADAAATLVGLAALWRLELGRDELTTLAADLGSDVPFALHGGTALASGRGEQLVPVLTRHTFHWALAFDSKGLSTPRVYAELDQLRSKGRCNGVGEVEPVLEALASGDPRQLALLLGNDLQAAAISLRPSLRRTLRAGVAAGALAGIVSGSGPSTAFLCADANAAVRVAAELAGSGVCRTVRVASGPVAGARVISGDGDGPGAATGSRSNPPEVHA